MVPFLRKLPSLAVIGIVFLAGVLHAQNVVVSTTEGAVLNYISQPLNFFRSNVVGGSVVKVLPHPAGAKVYILSSDPARSIVIFNSDFVTEASPAKSIGGVSNGWLTPDGSKLLVAAGSLRIFNTADDKELTSASGLNTIPGPTDVAISPDSSQAHVFSSSTQKIYTIDLTKTNFPVTATGGVSALSGTLQLAPNGLLYLATSNKLFEFDSRTLTSRGDISFSGQPGSLLFNAASNRAYTASSQISGTAPVLIFNLDNRSVSGAAAGLGITFKELVVAGPTRLIGISNETGKIYQILESGAVTELVFTGTNTGYTGAVGLAVSEEVPQPKALYIAFPDKVVKVDLLNDTVLKVAAVAPVNGEPDNITYLKRAASGAPVNAILYNNNQSVLMGTTGAPLGVRITNSAGQPLSGVTVQFATTQTGASLSATSVITNTEGYAYTTLTAPSAATVMTVSATAPGINSLFTINVTSTPPTNGGGTVAPGAPAVFSGNGQLAFQSSPVNFPLVVIVKDAAGKPMPSVPVAWSVIQGTATINSNPSTTTDAQGKAQATVIGSIYVPPLVPYEKSVITATTSAGTASFALTTLGNTSSGQGASINARLVKPEENARIVTAKVGDRLNDFIQVYIETTYFNQTVIPDVSIDVSVEQGSGPTVACAGGPPVTNGQGIANCDLVIGGKPGEVTLTVTMGGFTSFLNAIRLTATPGDPAEILPVQGNNATGNPGQTVSLIAKIQDAAGNALPGAQAQFEVVTPGSATLSKTTDVSNSIGQVSTIATLGAVGGPIQIRVRSGGAVFNFTINVNFQIGSFTKVEGGDNQTASQGAAFKNPLAVKVLDANNQPVVGASVAFAVTQGTAFLSSPTAVTDASGVASVTATASTDTGPVAVSATLGTQSVAFALTVIPPGPSITGFFNAAGFQQGLAPGALVRVVGTNLAPQINGVKLAPSALGPWPYELDGVSIQVAGIQAPIYALSNVNGEEGVTFQVPFDVPPGNVSITVKANDGSSTVDNVTVAAYNPGIFQVSRTDGKPYAVVVRPDGSFVTPENPAHRGEILTAYATGLGAVTPAPGTNTAGIGGQMVTGDLVVGVNDAGMRVISGEYAKNLIGVYVVTFELAEDTPTGTDRNFVIAVRSGTDLVFSNASVLAAIQ